MTELALAWLASAIGAFVLIAVLRASRFASALADLPNERSLHAKPTPRVGGLGLVAVALPIAAWLGDSPIAILAGCAAMLAVVSAADDVRSLPIAVRLPAHIAAATVAILAIGGPARAHGGLGIVEAAAAILAVVWMTNLYNFMDGSDGLAGGMAVIGFGALAIAATCVGAWPLAAACGALACASAGFLAHNFPPARAFLGDAGSVPLGFLAASLGLHGALVGAWPIAFPLLVFSPFIADATVTLARRMARGEAFWRAHRSHYYQRLVLGGWSRGRLALAAYALMLAAAAGAFALLAASPEGRFAIIVGWAALYGALFTAIAWRVPPVAT